MKLYDCDRICSYSYWRSVVLIYISKVCDIRAFDTHKQELWEMWEKKPRSTNFSISRCFLSINELNAPEFARGVINWSSINVYVHPKYFYSKYQSLSCTWISMRTHWKASFWSKTRRNSTWASTLINRRNSSRRFKTHSKRTQTKHKRMKEYVSTRRSIYRSLTPVMGSIFTKVHKSGNFGHTSRESALVIAALNDASKRSNQQKTRSRHSTASMHKNDASREHQTCAIIVSPANNCLRKNVHLCPRVLLHGTSAAFPLNIAHTSQNNAYYKCDEFWMRN